MSKTYQATGINLQGIALGESDRLLTILTPEFGILRAVAPGARKPKSSLRGKSELFVVNQLMLAKGKSLDKIAQAETIKSYYGGLSKNLAKLAASQYLAEIVLVLALSEQPQREIYYLLNEHLQRIESSSHGLHAHLAQAVFHLLTSFGIVPQVNRCCWTQQLITLNFTDANWRVGFSFAEGGIVNLLSRKSEEEETIVELTTNNKKAFFPQINYQLNAVELILLQKLAQEFLPQPDWVISVPISDFYLESTWIKIEKILREYCQYHLGKNIRSAVLIDSLSG